MLKNSFKIHPLGFWGTLLSSNRGTQKKGSDSWDTKLSAYQKKKRLFGGYNSQKIEWSQKTRMVPSILKTFKFKFIRFGTWLLLSLVFNFRMA